MTQNHSLALIAQIESRFQTVGQPVSYISADEMAYLQARARSLRAESSREFFAAVGARIASLFHSPARPAQWNVRHAVTAK